jgi:hypothetical protein
MAKDCGLILEHENIVDLPGGKQFYVSVHVAR